MGPFIPKAKPAPKGEDLSRIKYYYCHTSQGQWQSIARENPDGTMERKWYKPGSSFHYVLVELGEFLSIAPNTIHTVWVAQVVMSEAWQKGRYDSYLRYPATPSR